MLFSYRHSLRWRSLRGFGMGGGYTENLFELFAEGYISTFSAMDIAIKRDGVAAREALLDDF